MKLTIDELAEKINKNLNLLQDDKRISNKISVRRIRDYMSKGLLDKPFKEGKSIYFTELHYNKLLSLREMQSNGITDNNLKKIISTEINNENLNPLQVSAMSAIESIKSFSNQNMVKSYGLSNNYSEDLINTFSSITKKENILITKNVSKSWQEIQLVNNKNIFLRYDNINLTNEEKKEIINNLKNILGEKND